MKEQRSSTSASDVGIGKHELEKRVLFTLSDIRAQVYGKQLAMMY